MTKVLVVEDEPSIGAVVKYHLEGAGFEGLFAGDVEEGWRLLVSQAPDAAVVDIRLPGSDGWTLLERVRRDRRFHRLPIVVLTGLLDPSVVERSRRLGCDYLSKPFAATALLNKVRHMLQSQQGSITAAAEMPPVDQRMTMHTVAVMLLLDDYRIEGVVHLPPELARFSDAWESIMRDNRLFFPVTDATVRAPSGDVVARTAFMQVRKEDVRGVYPLDLAP